MKRSPPALASDGTVPVSRKKAKKLADQRFDERFSLPSGEAIWDASLRVERADFARDVMTGAAPRRREAPSVAVERARCEGVAKTRKALATSCGDKCPSMAFERWHLAAASEGDGGDSVFPRGGGDVLRRDLVASRHAPEAADRIVASHLAAVAAARGRVAAVSSSSRPAVEATAVSRSREGGDVVLRADRARVALPEPVYSKLRELASRAAASAEGAVDEAILRMTMRYDALGGAGYQAALPPRAFRALRDRFGVTFECFASPLNCFFERYGSAHADVDAAFGSVGSFYTDFEPRRGSYECNPPFAPAPLLRAASRCGALLEAAEARGDALSFAFVAPCWTDQEAWTAISASAFNRGVVRVPREDHAWRDVRVAKARRVPVDTAIFFLMTSAAHAARPCDAERLGAVRASLLVPPAP